MKRSRWIALGILILFVVTIYQYTSKAEQATPLPTEYAPKADHLAPPFKLPGLDNKIYEVGGKRDKALVINFWASWCGPCHEEAPDLVEFGDKFKDDLDIYAVNMLSSDKMKDVEAFVERYGFTFPVLIDEDDTVTDLYMLMAFPTNILIDRNGVIQEVVIGLLPPEELEKKLRNLMKIKQVG